MARAARGADTGGMHRTLMPRILYFGTPVVLLSTLNEDGTPNLAPMSSAWWLDDSAMLGLGTRSQTFENLRRDGQCVLNLPDVGQVDAVDRLALTTARDPLPEYKREMGFETVRGKFGRAGLTPVPSETVRPPRAAECPVQLEAEVVRIHDFGSGHAAAIEARVVRCHIHEGLLREDRRHHVDPDRWRPLIMSFCEFYGLGPRVHPSRLAEVF